MTRQTNKQTNRQTDRQTDKQTYRQTDRQTDRQTARRRSIPSVPPPHPGGLLEAYLTAKTALKGPQDGSKTPSRRHKRPPRGAMTRPRGPKMLPETPGTAKMTSKWGQIGTKIEYKIDDHFEKQKIRPKTKNTIFRAIIS